MNSKCIVEKINLKIRNSSELQLIESELEAGLSKSRENTQPGPSAATQDILVPGIHGRSGLIISWPPS